MWLVSIEMCCERKVHTDFGNLEWKKANHLNNFLYQLYVKMQLFILLFLFAFKNVATGKFEMTYVTRIIFLLDSAALTFPPRPFLWALKNPVLR